MFNPIPVYIMIFGGSLGFAIAGSFGMSIGIAVTSAIVTAINFID